ncbi:UNC93-like protein [Phlebotomus argentipes]|uniref:UNC93-like protein n=1 Tax=Phlebotomus argentipes TaxID=94469 RepID=UPI0028930A62|nr:UNC93-like protein [Phlebotomus argentipes]
MPSRELSDPPNGVASRDEHSETGLSPHENLRIIKNVIILGFAFMVHFTAFHGTSNLQSSVNSDASLGTFTLAAIYGSLILSNIFLPAAVIRWLGCKWTIALSFVAYMPFIAAQFYPRAYTLLPAGLAVGFGGGLLWCAKCTYLTVVAESFTRFGGRNDKKSDVAVVRFFGLFFVFYQMAQVWGNLISSSVLTHLTGSSGHSSPANSSHLRDVAAICGSNYCPSTVSAMENANLRPPEPWHIHILSGIFLACMLTACLAVAFGVDPLTRYEKKRRGAGLSGLKLLAVTLRQLKERYQLLLLPITAFIGAEQAFIAVDFTASFVACGWGISNIGYAMIFFGVANAVGSALAGALTKITGRLPVLLGNLVLHSSLIFWMQFWRPEASSGLVYCLMAAVWGLADGVWLVQVNALSGILFPGKEEAAFSNFRLWEATGSVVTYSLSPYLCSRTKLYMLLVLMFVGMTGFGTIEVMERRQKKNPPNEKSFELVAGSE